MQYLALGLLLRNTMLMTNTLDFAIYSCYNHAPVVINVVIENIYYINIIIT